MRRLAAPPGSDAAILREASELAVKAARAFKTL